MSCLRERTAAPRLSESPAPELYPSAAGHMVGSGARPARHHGNEDDEKVAQRYPPSAMTPKGATPPGDKWPRVSTEPATALREAGEDG